jgi:hypothetical protein
MFSLNQTLSLLIPITALIWLAVAIYQLRTNKISSRVFIAYFIIGLVICIMAAYRDGYGFSDASLIPLSSTLSTGLSTLGLLLFVITFVGVFNKSLDNKTRLFALMIFIFVLKFLIVEFVSFGKLL